MQEEKGTEKTLVMYDVRGIQNFIFRTNKVKEIIGASRIVENIILDALKDGLKKVGLKEDEYICHWENDEELKILSDDSIAAQVLFIGGGNAYVMYRDKNLAVEVNKKMSRYVLDKTYSLQLAIAMVPKSPKYSNDYRDVQNKMTEIKASMPYSGCLGAIPVVAVDDMTGFPYSIDGKEIDGKETDGEEILKKKAPEYKDKLSYESIQKLISFYQSDTEGKEKIHDNLVTEFGKDSTLAVVHIDGNNMGMRIRKLMEDIEDYVEAVKRMRTISKNINDSFKRAFEETRGNIKKVVMSLSEGELKGQENEQEPQYVRKILVAGDDITFVCNAKLALPFVKQFTQNVARKVMFVEETKNNIEEYGFSVCAGIAYVHSHFPFHTAYEVAEECCSSAKSRAKKEGNKLGERIGNWVDFQICKSVHNIDLDKSRKKNYVLPGKEYLLRRPYYIEVETCDEPNEVKEAYAKLNEINKEYSYRHFENLVKNFRDDTKIPHSLAKELRNTYPLGADAVEELIEFAHSRNKLVGNIGVEKLSDTTPNPGFLELDGQCVAAWYDALEMMDYYIHLDQKVSVGEEA